MKKTLAGRAYHGVYYMKSRSARLLRCALNGETGHSFARWPLTGVIRRGLRRRKTRPTCRYTTAFRHNDCPKGEICPKIGIFTLLSCALL